MGGEKLCCAFSLEMEDLKLWLIGFTFYCIMLLPFERTP